MRHREVFIYSVSRFHRKLEYLVRKVFRISYSHVHKTAQSTQNSHLRVKGIAHLPFERHTLIINPFRGLGFFFEEVPSKCCPSNLEQDTLYNNHEILI